MLQQVGHAGLAVIFMARSDQVGHVDGGRWLGVIWCEEHAQAVAGEAVFRDAFDAGYLRDACRQVECPARESQKAEHRAAQGALDGDGEQSHGEQS